jgi:predicted DNA-binding transcriptional regulator AlpA
MTAQVLDHDQLVPDPQVWKELGVSSMTGWRWSHDPALDFPPAVRIRGRNFRSRQMLERWKAKMMRRAIAQRSENKRPAATTP